MNIKEFESLFEKATNNGPFPYQVSLATSAHLPQILNAPTGSGKTDAVVLAWLWRRKQLRDATPRRLVYCLPMRVLVEQTRDKVKKWLRNLDLLAEKPGDEANKITVTVLMGGEDKDRWDEYPERDAIIIGTQDMLLSRALNRGYGMSRYRWPVHYALLNNDCLWVMDEVQLMGVGVETSAQLQAFREKLKCERNVKTIWMSATMDKRRLETYDHPVPEETEIHRLSERECENNLTLKKRLNAKKPVKKFGVQIGADDYFTELAKKIVDGHQKGTLTLVIVNTVERARKVYAEVEKEIGGKKNISHALIHSRFRPTERKENLDLLVSKDDEKKDRIVVATQVVEAGVDISAALLITEIAPWPSLVQRFGRCNRYGECNDNSEILWTDSPTVEREKGKKGKNDYNAPYDPDEIAQSRELLAGMEDGGIKNLENVGKNYRPKPVERQVIRKRDVLDLFDTTTDLTGNDLDISRFIRETDDTDVQVFWRQDVDEKREDFDYETPDREELCSVPIGDAKTLLPDYDKKEARGASSKKKKAFAGFWRYNPRDKRLERINNANRIAPGQILLLDCKAGGYDKRTGWNVELVGKNEVNELGGEAAKRCPKCKQRLIGLVDDDSLDSDYPTFIGKDIPLTQHLNDVESEAFQLAKALELEQEKIIALTTAARWHDIGKSHNVFQDMLRKANPGLPGDAEQLWAKSKEEQCVNCGSKLRKQVRYERPRFRHELASALAWLQNGTTSQANADLIAYLIAAHHGKVRLLLRSMPGETKPSKGESYARGVWNGDALQPVPPLLPSGAKLDLTLMELGEGSWLEKTLGLRDNPTIGPFRLAYYETILRIADWRASSKEAMQ